MEAVTSESADLGESFFTYGATGSGSRIERFSLEDSVSLRINDLYHKNVREYSAPQEKEKEFDITVYQYHVECNNEESKRSIRTIFSEYEYWPSRDSCWSDLF